LANPFLSLFFVSLFVCLTFFFPSLCFHFPEDDEDAGVAKGDGKKAAAPLRDRSNRAAHADSTATAAH